jgi:hypothetical protein
MNLIILIAVPRFAFDGYNIIINSQENIDSTLIVGLTLDFDEARIAEIFKPRSQVTSDPRQRFGDDFAAKYDPA